MINDLLADALTRIRNASLRKMVDASKIFYEAYPTKESWDETMLDLCIDEIEDPANEIEGLTDEQIIDEYWWDNIDMYALEHIGLTFDDFGGVEGWMDFYNSAWE